MIDNSRVHKDYIVTVENKVKSQKGKVGDLLSSFSYFYLSHAMWGVSSIDLKKLTTSQTDSVKLLYIFFLLWSILIIMHLNNPERKDKMAWVHAGFAMIVFILGRFLLFDCANCIIISN
ncbi:hypothetical protein [Leptospira kmetyi]|uniref:hypothetical protein n=1 Tax=Leptospira kmetyi TaxID=408139 RepID=UPI003EB7C0B1